jgi:DNA polymerase-4
MARTVVHVDMDAFFVSVELLDHPELHGKAVAVGGSADHRGVISAASYPARVFGVHSAQPTRTAMQRCPGLILLPPRHDVYEACSRRLMALLQTVSPVVEPLSIDEAFLDVSGTEAVHGPPEQLARRLHARIHGELRLPVSIGVAANKLVAKIATEQAKPDNVCLVPAGQEAAFLAPLPVRSLWGVGPRTAALLAELGVATVGDITRAGRARLESRLGPRGAEGLLRRARGLDDAPVQPERETHQISQESTFARDHRRPEMLRAALLELSDGVGARLRAAGLTARTIGVKFRYADFTTFSRQTTLPTPTDGNRAIGATAWALFTGAWSGRAVRLLGVAAQQLGTADPQLDLFGASDERQQRLDRAVDAVRRRFGPDSVHRASALPRPPGV